jgi:glutamine kinase
MLSNKADTLINLKKNKIKFLIPRTKVYTVPNWKRNKEKIATEIGKYFKKKIIIRSSSYNEDSEFASSAGKYLTIPNIKPRNKKDLKNGINKVINSYRKNSLSRSKILIQEQIIKVSMSGVIFTHELETGAPYYVINYDDKTKKTNTVTSGADKESNKKLIVYREGLDSLRSKRFVKLINATIDLEKKVNNKFLDIEFAIDQKLNIYLLQVRRIVKTKNNIFLKDNSKICSLIKKTRTSLNNIYKKNFTVLGQMPDWNPAEIIGKNPDYLAVSLYKKIITDKNWLIARSQMGYKNFKSPPLMQILAGKPYIDTSLSFKSFLPSGLNSSASKKILNHWLQFLKKNPHKHDKIEFDVAITCFTFDINDKIKKLLPKSLSKNDIKQFVNLNKKNFYFYFNKKCKSNISNIQNRINNLKLEQEKFKIHNSSKKIFFEIKKTMKDCINLGAIPFAQSARHAFIAKSILKSMSSKKIITAGKIKKFESSLETITRYFLEDINNVVKKKISKSFFFKKYGHLRPGTYNLLSKNYKETKQFEFKKQKLIKSNSKSIFSGNDLKKIDQVLKSNHMTNITAKDLLNYISFFITFREYSKFIFTKNVNFILELLKTIGRKKNIDENDLIFLKYNEIINYKKNHKTLINRRKTEYYYNLKIKLPEVIVDDSGIDVIPYMFNVPNFITNFRVRAPINFINNKINNKLKNTIILIVNADPGFDWIFTKNIKGLITQYGGANSHMAIRCAELGIPAAIGCGEKKFEELKSAKFVELDCSLNTVKIIS